MRWEVGLGIRAWAKGIVIRIDTAVSDQEVGVQMMVAVRSSFNSGTLSNSL